jgi:hypothetical protein
MSQIEKKAAGCACGTSFKASTAAEARQGKTCACCGGACACTVKGGAVPQGDSCCCGESCSCGG